MKVCFETFGCRLNKAEALQMEADYLARGWSVTRSHADANLIVVRGCSVTARAQYECEKLIAHLKRRYPSACIKVCGCLKSNDSTPDSASKPLNPSTSQPLNFSTPQPLNFSTPQPLNFSTPQPLPVRTARAYLKVQDGCAGKCTFCIVPKFRGESKSVGFTALLDRARRFIDAGYREIVVTGCNLALYASEGRRLPDLVSALADLSPATRNSQLATRNPQLATRNPQLATRNPQPATRNPQPASCRIRLGSLEPGPCAIETIHALAEHPNACRFLHLPVQSGADRILTAMRRPYAVKDIEDAVSLASKLMPCLGLGCDLMAGFPGESELDHAATKGLIRRLPFSNAHVFPFSERPGTLASGFPCQLPRDLRSTRARDLSETIRSKRRKFAKSFIGKTVEIVVEDEKSGRGWTGEYLPCEPIGGNFVRKSTVRVFVTKTKDDLLIGRPQGRESRHL